MGMETNANANMPQDNSHSQSKVYSIAHESRMRKPWIIMPVGRYYNRELRNAKIGDILLFSDGKRREIEKIGIVPIKNWLTDYLCRKTYIAPLSVVAKRWDGNAEVEGYGHGSVSREECLLIFLKELPVNECSNLQCNKRIP